MGLTKHFTRTDNSLESADNIFQRWMSYRTNFGQDIHWVEEGPQGWLKARRGA